MKQSNNGKSFTLPELLIVIVIIGILTAITVPNYKSAQQRLALQRSAIKLAQDIRRAEEMAMSSKECNVCSSPGVPRKGYRIYFNLHRDNMYQDDKGYRLFGNDYEDDEEWRWSDDTLIETIELEKGIIISNIETVPVTGFPDTASINFKPPDPEISINWTLNEKAKITLCIEKTNCNISTNTKTVTVNRAGLIYVE